jgi:hypothetical protein
VTCAPSIMDRTIEFWYSFKLHVGSVKKMQYCCSIPLDHLSDTENVDSDMASKSDVSQLEVSDATTHDNPALDFTVKMSMIYVLIGLCENAVFFSDAYLENAAIAKLKHRLIRGFAHEMEIIEGCHKIYFKKVLSGMDAKLRKIFLAALVVNASNAVMGKYGHTWEMFTGEHPQLEKDFIKGLLYYRDVYGKEAA